MKFSIALQMSDFLPLYESLLHIGYDRNIRT